MVWKKDMEKHTQKMSQVFSRTCLHLHPPPRKGGGSKGVGVWVGFFFHQKAFFIEKRF